MSLSQALLINAISLESLRTLKFRERVSKGCSGKAILCDDLIRVELNDLTVTSNDARRNVKLLLELSNSVRKEVLTMALK